MWAALHLQYFCHMNQMHRNLSLCSPRIRFSFFDPPPTPISHNTCTQQSKNVLTAVPFLSRPLHALLALTKRTRTRTYVRTRLLASCYVPHAILLCAYFILRVLYLTNQPPFTLFVLRYRPPLRFALLCVVSGAHSSTLYTSTTKNNNAKGDAKPPRRRHARWHRGRLPRSVCGVRPRSYQRGRDL